MRINQTVEEKNKALVLDAFDTLFNSATTQWPSAISHLTTFSTAHIAPGREGLFDLIKSIPPTLRRFLDDA
jgi:hypothetical protein